MWVWLVERAGLQKMGKTTRRCGSKLCGRQWACTSADQVDDALTLSSYNSRGGVSRKINSGFLRRVSFITLTDMLKLVLIRQLFYASVMVMYLCMYVCMYVCICVCIYVRLYDIYIYIYIYIYIKREREREILADIYGRTEERIDRLIDWLIDWFIVLPKYSDLLF